MNSLLEVDKKNDSILDLIVNGEINNEEVSRFLTERNVTLNQIKIFKLAQAKKELSRVLKFTRLLQRIEDKYVNKLDDALEEDKFDLNEYYGLMNTINEMIARSNSVIYSVLKDDTLSNLVLVNTTNIHNGDNNNNIISDSPSLSNLADPDSRDRVMKTVNNVINILDQMSKTETEESNQDDGLDDPGIQSDLGELYIPHHYESNEDDSNG